MNHEMQKATMWRFYWTRQRQRTASIPVLCLRCCGTRFPMRFSPAFGYTVTLAPSRSCATACSWSVRAYVNPLVTAHGSKSKLRCGFAPLVCLITMPCCTSGVAVLTGFFCVYFGVAERQDQGEQGEDQAEQAAAVACRECGGGEEQPEKKQTLVTVATVRYFFFLP